MALKLTHDADWANFASITSYRRLNIYQLVDYDATNRPIFAFAGDKQFGRSFSQDLQITSNSDGQFNWVLGGMYFRDRSGFDVIRQIFPIIGVLSAGVPEVDINALIKTSAIAGYAQGSYKFSDQFEVTAGLRYSSEKKTLVRTDTIIPLANLTIPTVGTPTAKRWDALTPRVSLQYRPNSDIMLYASFDRGFKSGTFNSTQTSPQPCRTNAAQLCITRSIPRRSTPIRPA